MNLNQIDDSTKINPVGRELEYVFEDSTKDTAVLLIHGFGGKSTNWKYIAEKIKQELELPVYIPRLPGHGTNLSDFLNSSADQWLRKSIDSYIYLKSSYKNIYAAGLSMGGLLAALIASQFEVKKLSLIAPAFFTIKKSIAFTPFIKYFINEINNDFSLDKIEELSQNEIDYHKNYSFNYYPSALAELYKLMKEARSSVNKIESPTQLILTENDEQVATNEIKKFLNKKMGQFLKDQKTYQKSSHVIINDVEKQRCAEDIISPGRSDGYRMFSSIMEEIKVRGEKIVR